MNQLNRLSKGSKCCEAKSADILALSDFGSGFAPALEISHDSSESAHGASAQASNQTDLDSRGCIRT